MHRRRRRPKKKSTAEKHLDRLLNSIKINPRTTTTTPRTHDTSSYTTPPPTLLSLVHRPRHDLPPPFTQGAAWFARTSQTLEQDLLDQRHLFHNHIPQYLSGQKQDPTFFPSLKAWLTRMYPRTNDQQTTHDPVQAWWQSYGNYGAPTTQSNRLVQQFVNDTTTLVTRLLLAAEDQHMPPATTSGTTTWTTPPTTHTCSRTAPPMALDQAVLLVGLSLCRWCLEGVQGANKFLPADKDNRGSNDNKYQNLQTMGSNYLRRCTSLLPCTADNIHISTAVVVANLLSHLEDTVPTGANAVSLSESALLCVTNTCFESCNCDSCDSTLTTHGMLDVCPIQHVLAQATLLQQHFHSMLTQSNDRNTYRVLLSQKFGHLVASQKEVDCYGLLTLCKKPLNEALADSIRVPLEVCDIIVTLLKRGTRVLHNGKKKSRMVAKDRRKGGKKTHGRYGQVLYRRNLVHDWVCSFEKNF